MGSDNRYDGLEAYALKMVRTKARQLVGSAGFFEADLHDIEQELMIDLWRRLPRFDAARASLHTFIARVVEHHVATLVEAQKAGVRDYRKVTGSLDDRRPDEGGAGDDGPPLVTMDGLRRRLLAEARRDEEIRDLRRDLERVLAELPADLQDLCRRLQVSSVSEVSRETGVPRSTLYDAMAKIQERFEVAGLAAYLRAPTHPGGRR